MMTHIPTIKEQLEPEPPEEQPPGTRLESVEELRRVLRGQRAATAQEPQGEPETVPFRPVRRPPLAVLIILDDGSHKGEEIRLRAEIIIIGRTEGDVLIPHDPQMSGKHAEISRVLDKGKYRWYLTDLQSRNGTFVRVASTLLKNEQEILIGSRRFRFDAAVPGAAVGAAAEAPAPLPGTSDWQVVLPADLVPSLVEIKPQAEGQRFFLNQADNWIGRDPSQCNIALADDLMVSPRHARLYKDAKGRWLLENLGSRNGTWIRINRLPLEGNGYFQLGEQRFFIRIC